FTGGRRGRDIRCGKRADSVRDVGLAPVYIYLGVAYSRLGMFDQALAAFKYARHLEPSDSEVYVKIALTCATRGQLDDAATALIQCVMLDGTRSDAWTMLADVYSRMNTDGVPALVPAPGGKVQLNLACRVVRENFCTAYRDFVRIFRRAKKEDMAKAARDAAV